MYFCLRSLLKCSGLLFLASFLALAQDPELVVQTGHSDAVLSVAYSPDGKTLASADGSEVKVWDVATGGVLLTLKESIYSVAFSPDGTMLAGGSSDGIVRLWTLRRDQESRSLKFRSERNFRPQQVSAVAFSPDGRFVAGTSADSIIKILDVNSGAEILKLIDDDLIGRITSLSFKPDGSELASASYSDLIGGEIKLWDLKNGAELFKLTTRKGPDFGIKSYQATLSLAFSPDGQSIAYGSADQTITLLNAATGESFKTLKGHLKGVTSVAYSPDGKVLASGSDDQTVKLWDVSIGTQLRTLKGHGAWVSSVTFSPDGQTVASASHDRTIKLWSVNSGSELRTFTGHDWWVQTVAFDPDGKVLASGSNEGPLGLWNLSVGGELRNVAGDSTEVESVAFSPDGKVLAGARSYYIDGVPHGEIKLWDATGREMRTLAKEPVIFDSIAFHPSGTMLLSLSNYHDSSWTTFNYTAKIWGVKTGNEMRQISGVKHASFSPDGKFLAVMRDTDNPLYGKPQLLDIASGSERWSLTAKGYDSYSPVVFSNDGHILALVKWEGSDVEFVETATGATTRTLSGGSLKFGVIAFSPDGKVLASGSRNGVIKLWDVSTGQELRTFAGHTSNIYGVAFSPHGEILASGSADSKLKLWDVTDGTEIATLISLPQNGWLVVTPDGLFDGSPSAWSQILWRFSKDIFDVAPVEVFFNEFYHPGLLADIFSGRRPKAPSDISQKDRRQPQLQLRLADAESNARLAGRDVRVKIDVTQAGAGAQDVRLFRNGSLVKAWHGDVLKGRSGVTLETTIPIVAGENRLTAYAFNHDNIKSSDAQLAITGADSLRRKGAAYVLAIGVNRYADPQYNLKYAVADAQDFAGEFRRQQSSLNQYERVETIVLPNERATKANILKSLSDLAAKIQPEDALIIYFAGHGTAQKNRFYLIPHDLGYAGSRTQLDKIGLQKILAHSVSDEELERAVEGIDAGQLLLVIDACNSGQALEAEEKRRGPMNSKGLAQLAYEKGMYILTAAQSYQAAQEASRLGHGFLTYALVEEGLKSDTADKNPKDGQVLLREWLDFATSRVPEMQLEKVEEQKKQGRQLEQIIVFAEGDKSMDRQVQRPRVFYRREAETSPLVVARP